jgi:hypothetical protein
VYINETPQTWGATSNNICLVSCVGGCAAECISIKSRVFALIKNNFFKVQEKKIFMCTKKELSSGFNRFEWVAVGPFQWPPIEEEEENIFLESQRNARINRERKSEFPQYSTIFRVHTYCHCHIHIYMRPQMNIFSSPTAAVVGGRFEAQNFSFSLCLCASFFHSLIFILSLSLTIAMYSLTHSVACSRCIRIFLIRLYSTFLYAVLSPRYYDT